MTNEEMLGRAMTQHKAGELDSAARLYETILSQNPNDADVLNLLGVLALQRGRLDDAQNLIQQAIGVNPEVAEYHHNLGQVLKHQNNVDGARKCFRHCLALNPDLKVAQEQVPDLDSGENMPRHEPDCGQEDMKHLEVIQHVINAIGGQTYLEIGIDSGQTLSSIKAARKIGVDPVPTTDLIHKMLGAYEIDYFRYGVSDRTGSSQLMLTAGSKHPHNPETPAQSTECYYMTSDVFFARKAASLFHSEKIDVAFVDGLHTHEQTYQDIINVLGHLNTNGVILVHDCNPPTEPSAYPALSWEDARNCNLPGWDGLWCGDVWKAIVRLRATRDDLSIFVLDCDFGIGVITQNDSSSLLDYSSDDIRSLKYHHLKANRQQLLNLKPQGYLHEFVSILKKCRHIDANGPLRELTC